MGTDISGNIEIWNGNSWKQYKRLYCGLQYYEMFGILAGYRGHDNPIKQCKGFPFYASKNTKERFESYGKDAFYTSYLNWKEIKKYDWEQDFDEKTKAKDCITKGWNDIFEIMKRLSKKYGNKDVRIVFWFSN